MGSVGHPEDPTSLQEGRCPGSQYECIMGGQAWRQELEVAVHISAEMSIAIQLAFSFLFNSVF